MSGSGCIAIPVLSDNYTYVFHSDGRAAIIDPPVVEPILDVVETNKLSVECILITHYHRDHTGGAEAIKAATGAEIYGPNDARLGFVPDQILDEGNELTICGKPFQVMDLPGHTVPHLVYYCSSSGMLWVGDVLFGGGCGRLFDGSAEMMWESMCRLSKLPDNTLIYFGHEYTLHNLRFMLSLDPQNILLLARIKKEEACLASGKFTTPTRLSVEKQTNFLLNPDFPGLGEGLSLKESSALERFTKIRQLRDNY
jgi:hydroxyacylglutathione hydrolase